MLNTALILFAAITLDWLLGEPRRWHPLVGFGRLASYFECKLYGGSTVTPLARQLRGSIVLLLMLLPFIIVAVTVTLISTSDVNNLFSMLVVYLAIGHKSLHDHARPVVIALQNNDTDEARRLTARMVSRDSASIDIPSATTESVLENGNDGVFGVLFWFVIAGVAGAVLYRLANTLDAMWGYRNERYQNFGWAAARFDDLMNFIPARITALTYALLGNTRQALNCWRTQASAWDSPNAGPVMAAGAGALGIVIGGPACYLGKWHQRPILGAGKVSGLSDIECALGLVRRGVYLWIFVLLIAGGLANA